MRIVSDYARCEKPLKTISVWQLGVAKGPDSWQAFFFPSSLISPPERDITIQCYTDSGRRTNPRARISQIKIPHHHRFHWGESNTNCTSQVPLHYHHVDTQIVADVGKTIEVWRVASYHFFPLFFFSPFFPFFLFFSFPRNQVSCSLSRTAGELLISQHAIVDGPQPGWIFPSRASVYWCV